jgi:hypothetical protein
MSKKIMAISVGAVCAAVVAIIAIVSSGHSSAPAAAKPAASATHSTTAKPKPIIDPQKAHALKVAAWTVTNDMAGRYQRMGAHMSAAGDAAGNENFSGMHTACSKIETDLNGIAGTLPAPDASLNRSMEAAVNVGLKGMADCQSAGMDNIDALETTATDMHRMNDYIQQGTARTNVLTAIAK